MRPAPVQATSGGIPIVLRRTSRFLRLAAAGATVSIPLFGAVTAVSAPTLSTIGWVAVIGFAHHLFSFVLNDVVDLPIDRTEPRRANSPLVQGLVSPGFALGFALFAAALGIALSWWLEATPLALGLLLSSCLFVAAYDLWGKKTPVPPVIDLVQGLGWALLAWFGAEFAGGATMATGVFCVFLVGYIALANGVHGGLRDLGNDLARGASTTAVYLGAKPLSDGGADVSPALRRYALRLETWNAIVIALLVPALGYRGWTLAYAFAAWLLLFVASRRLLVKGLDRSRERRSMMVYGTSHLIASFSIAIALLVPVAPPVIAIFVLLVYVSPLLSYGWLFDAVLRVPDPRGAR